jgi:valyl-tRNA synthetase
MEKTYTPQHFEQKIYLKWEKASCFQPSGKGEPYCIMLPPPNVTGNLHMGHGFQDAIMDALTRYYRMRGYNTLWQPGTDHAGIATQMVVERRLLAEGKSRHNLGREAFVEKIWQWKEHSGDTILQQMRRLGASADWSKTRFTMDEDLAEVVRDVFIQLFDEDLIYRKKRLVNWDPILHTAISDLEVINEEEDGFLWYFKYPLADGSDHLVIATTRPETMLGDSAVAVHPQDKRYQHLIGKKIKLPLTEREISIVADEYVDPQFGTGCVKITPAHDFNDNEVGKHHNLPLINILNFDATLNENTPAKYQGMDRFVARKQIIKDIKNLGLLAKIEPYKLKVPRGDRSKAIIEPWLTDQWYVKIAPLAKPAIEAVKNKEIKFVPETWSKTYFQWMNNIQDWCISRQLWWGHRIPAWYDNDGKAYVGKDEKDVRKKYKLKNDIELKQDEDVLDTWFSSALWPFSTLGWPQKTTEMQTFYPTSVLVTGFDIIFFWVARMIMMGLKFTGKVPFKEVYITGLIRDQEGHKMSKSKGNVLDPIDLIDGINLNDLIQKRTTGLMQPEMQQKIAANTKKHFPQGIAAYGTDALRATYCSLASTGRDIVFDLGRLEGYRNFCNKLWNATRYVLQKSVDKKHTPEEFKFSFADRWILSLLQTTIQKAREYFKTYRFDLLMQLIYDFTWHEYCDWYLELSKTILFDEAMPESIKEGTISTLIIVLEVILRILHPVMPFVTEQLWQAVGPLASKSGETIMLQPYPNYEEALTDQAAENDINWIKSFILGVRNIRGEMNISPGKKLAVLLRGGTKKDKECVKKHPIFLTQLAKLESVKWLEKNAAPPPCATALVGKLEILIPITDLVDIEEETKRLTKEIIKLEKDLTRSETKLNNPNFIQKAPPEIITKEQKILAETKMALERLKCQLGKLIG